MFTVSLLRLLGVTRHQMEENLVELLEAYRKGNHLSKVQMANIIGAGSKQQYQNWVSRNSLPKSFIGPALKILKQNGSISRKQAEILESLELLSDDDALMVEKLIRSLAVKAREDKQ